VDDGDGAKVEEDKGEDAEGVVNEAVNGVEDEDNEAEEEVIKIGE
jgi:hypothetical protein